MELLGRMVGPPENRCQDGVRDARHFFGLMPTKYEREKEQEKGVSSDQI